MALFAGMAHEIKNSLVAVRTMTDLVLEKDPQFELGQVVRRELDRISSAVSQMLRCTGRSQVPWAQVNLEEILENAVRVLRAQAAGRPISFDVTKKSPDCTVWGDARQLEQVFLNLGRNAIESMPETGRLTIETSTQDWALPPDLGGRSGAAKSARGCVVVFRDTGSGISAADMERLFREQFTTKASGNGIGLFITQGILRAHGGFIRVASQLGKGSTFSVFLPLYPQRPGQP